MAGIEIGRHSLDGSVAGAGPPLLFLHGGDYVSQNAAFLDRLARHWRVTAPRHPGFGHSERPEGFRTVHDLAYLYLDWIDRQAERCRGRRLLLRRLDRARNVRALGRADRPPGADRLARGQIRRARGARHRRHLRPARGRAAPPHLFRSGARPARLRGARRRRTDRDRPRPLGHGALWLAPLYARSRPAPMAAPGAGTDIGAVGRQ